jgi:hypothetical protein
LRPLATLINVSGSQDYPGSAKFARVFAFFAVIGCDNSPECSYSRPKALFPPCFWNSLTSVALQKTGFFSRFSASHGYCSSNRTPALGTCTSLSRFVILDYRFFTNSGQKSEIATKNNEEVISCESFPTS